MMKFAIKVASVLLVLVVSKCSYAVNCDIPGWASCEELSGVSGTDCSVFDCTREYTYDALGEITGRTPMECVKVDGQYLEFEAGIGGDVRIRIQNGSTGESGFTGWTNGDNVVCTKDFVCNGCQTYGYFEMSIPCSGSTTNNKIYADSLGVAGTQCTVN